MRPRRSSSASCTASLQPVHKSTPYAVEQVSALRENLIYAQVAASDAAAAAEAAAAEIASLAPLVQRAAKVCSLLHSLSVLSSASKEEYFIMNIRTQGSQVTIKY